MTDFQQRFVDEYCIDCIGAAAYRRAGYEGENARQLAYELRRDNAEVAAAIKERLDNLAMTAEVAVKHLSDIANTRLNDFFVVREAQGHELTEQYVTVLLAAAQDEIEAVRAFMDANVPGKRARKPFLKRIEALQLLCLDYEADIARWGKDITRLAPGKPCVVKVAELDLVAVAEAHELGRVESFSQGKAGIKIKMYQSDSAAKTILQYHGKLINKHEIDAGGSFLDFLKKANRTGK